MNFDSDYLERRLASYWKSLPNSRLLSTWQPSLRFPELTYVREDLVGSYKARKYRSLVPWMKDQGFRRVALRGSSHSGNTLQLSLLLCRHGIEAIYILEGREGPPVGNGLLNRLVLGESFFEQDPELAVDWTVPEGASCPQSLAGSLGLAGALVEQVITQRALPEKIYVDSGTGFTAAALLLGLGYFALPVELCVVSMTGQSEKEFAELLDFLTPEYSRLMEEDAVVRPYQMAYPSQGQSFGSLPRRVFAEIERFAQEEGLLVDPLYTAKLSLYYQEVRASKVPALLFVGGGQSDLLGFQGPLQQWVKGRRA